MVVSSRRSVRKAKMKEKKRRDGGARKVSSLIFAIILFHTVM